MIFLLLTLFAIISFIVYKWATVNFDYFEKRNIPFDKPFPILGSQKDLIFKKISVMDQLNKLYTSFNTSVFGIFDQRTPMFGIRDAELLKQILVKDFDHFINHRQAFNEQFGGLTNLSVFQMRNDRWKNMRATLNPLFTGSKLRHLFTYINKVAYDAVEFLTNKENAENLNEFNIKNYFSCFSNDIMASTIFGIEINSLKDENNEFFRMGKKITNITFLQSLKFLMYTNFKPVMKLFKLTVFDKKDTDFFMNLVLGTMKYRQENKIIRHDMINLMLEAKGIFLEENDKNQKSIVRDWTDEEIVAQFFLFVFAGFDTTALFISFTTHELMENPDCQERLRREIFEIKENLDGKPLTYDILNNMKYMDMVVSESLRRWPPSGNLERECNKDFYYKDDTVGVHFKPGDGLLIPLVGYHLDERYHSDPLQFDPERFSDENKANIKPCTYFPFGVGPRACIGKRLAIIEGKAILFYLLSKFRIEASSKTTRPMKLKPNGIRLTPKNGFWLKLVPLSNLS